MSDGKAGLPRVFFFFFFLFFKEATLPETYFSVVALKTCTRHLPNIDQFIHSVIFSQNVFLSKISPPSKSSLYNLRGFFFVLFHRFAQTFFVYLASNTTHELSFFFFVFFSFCAAASLLPFLPVWRGHPHFRMNHFYYSSRAF